MIELTDAELVRMLELGESLFVEHKSGIGEDSHYQAAKAVSSFANTLGGWLLIGVHERKPVGSEPSWAATDSPPLVDMIRDRLRGEVDPLPAFEAKTMRPPSLDGPVGVVRVYESSDRCGWKAETRRHRAREAEVRGRSDPHPRSANRACPKRRGGGSSRPSSHGLPEATTELVEDRIGLTFELVGEQHWQPRVKEGFGSIFVRTPPYTGSARFHAWATTAEAVAAAIGAAEALAKWNGLGNDYAKPNVSGVFVSVRPGQSNYHADSAGKPLSVEVVTAVESAGVVGSALHLEEPDERGLRSRVGVFDLAHAFVVPAIEATLQILAEGGFLGRVLCRIDFVALGRAIGLEWAAADASLHAHVESDLSLPLDADEIKAVARLATTTLGRSAGLPTWDEPPGTHSRASRTRVTVRNGGPCRTRAQTSGRSISLRITPLSGAPERHPA